MEFSHEFELTVKNINEIIESYLPEREGLQKLVIDAMDYSVEAGGKRIRPMLMLKSFELYKDRMSSEKYEFLLPVVHSFMTALEMIHTFSLCHDDLPCMDNDKYRRGRESTWYKYGEDMGTLAGDGLTLYAFELVSGVFDRQLKKVRSGEADVPAETLAESSQAFVKAVNILSGKSGIYGMLGGQSVDVEMTGKALNDEQLMFIYRLKTGALLQCALMIGAELGGASEDDLKKLSDIGEKIGVSFQIQDDILDETSTVEELGKPIHSDEENQKTTYVSIYGLEKAAKEVEKLSHEAIDSLIELEGVNEDARAFLVSLTDLLIHRKK